MPSDETRRISDAGTLKAFSHPLRIALYRALVVARTATASQLADQVDEAVSLVSYHLRRLAEHGLIEAAEPGSGDGRERWWRPAAESLTVRHEDVRDAPEKLAAQGVLVRALLEQRVQMYRRHLDESATWDGSWRSAGFDGEYLPRLNAAELTDLQHELDALLRKYQALGRAAEEAGDTEGRENVAVHVQAFPFRA
ncbi:helix-turn-helix domain-containing protein [Streptomyces griseoviridis]|uniref:helix-turn-helix domain-containing protein n=1 Tax=Streptomyces TaxID=1883 RepID=UPI0024738174|nr:helix-turn-helix domain-containing protein [Streptomyces sp. MAA16]MDH6698222.1 DNA-binding transcriptional ArsR family regulator [Streptomyces sp. MAA16]